MDIVADTDALFGLVMFAFAPIIIIALYSSTIFDRNMTYRTETKPKKVIVIPLAILSIVPWLYAAVAVFLQAIFGNQW